MNLRKIFGEILNFLLTWTVYGIAALILLSAMLALVTYLFPGCEGIAVYENCSGESPYLKD